MQSFISLFHQSLKAILKNLVTRKNQLSEKVEENFFQKSVIGQLIDFIYTFLNVGVEMAKKAREEASAALNKLGAKEKKEQQKQAQFEEYIKEAMIFLSKHTGSVEILWDDEIYRVRFPILTHFQFLPKVKFTISLIQSPQQKEAKIQFHQDVERVTVQTKIQGLVQEIEPIIEICKHEERLEGYFKKSAFISIIANKVSLWKDISFQLAIFINLLILVSYSDQFGEPNESESFNRMYEPRLFLSSDFTLVETKTLFFRLGMIQMICIFCVVTFFLLKKAPIVIRKAWGGQWKRNKDQRLLGYFFSLIYKSILMCVYLVITPEILYYLAYAIFVYLGVYYHPFFFFFHLSEILIRYEILKNVIKAVAMPFWDLFFTLLFICLITYWFSNIGYLYYYDQYADWCNSTYVCFMMSFLWVLKYPEGGFGTKLTENVPLTPDNLQRNRILFDLAGCIILIIILLQIFSGIIIDKFSELREELGDQKYDMQNNCFICGENMETFDRVSQDGFEHHIKIEHYMWDYLFYIGYIKEKNSLDYNGIESFIFENIEKNNYGWFPINRAIALEANQDKQEQHEEYDNLMTDIVTELNDIKTVTSNIKDNSAKILIKNEGI